MSVKWSGVEQTLDSLDELELRIREEVTHALDRYGNTAITNMRANHANDAHEIQRFVNRTWNLTQSLVYSVSDWENDVQTLTMTTPVDYAEAVEEGTSHSRPYPFFWVEVYGQFPKAQEDVEKSVLLVMAEHERLARAA